MCEALPPTLETKASVDTYMYVYIYIHTSMNPCMATCTSTHINSSFFAVPPIFVLFAVYGTGLSRRCCRFIYLSLSMCRFLSLSIYICIYRSVHRYVDKSIYRFIDMSIRRYIGLVSFGARWIVYLCFGEASASPGGGHGCMTVLTPFRKVP